MLFLLQAKWTDHFKHSCVFINKVNEKNLLQCATLLKYPPS